MRIDRNRVKEYCSTIKEVLTVLDFSIDKYSFSETKQDLSYKQSIRMCILDINTSLGKYIYIALFKSIWNQCKRNALLRDVQRLRW